MKSLKIFTLLVLRLLFISQAAAQDFLAYFNGNQDSLVAAASQLIEMPDPVFPPIDLVQMGEVVLENADSQKTPKAHEHYFTVRDQAKIFAWEFSKKSPYTFVLVHGVKSTADDYVATATLLQEATGAEVYALDLRGHGRSEGKSGDVDYIGQYADDVADVIAAIRMKKPDGKIILAGHSMGGGVALRYPMDKTRAKIDGFLLFAPLLGHNSPAFPQAQANEQTPGVEAYMQIHIPRIIGLKMLNAINRHEHDDLPVLFFNLPEHTPLRQYTYRANMSMAPDNYAAGLQAVDTPMLVLVGSKDEAFVAAALQKAVLENSKGEVQIIEGATHKDITCHPQASQRIAEWFSKLP